MYKRQHIKNPQECKELLINSIKEQMQVGETAYEFEHRTSVVLVIGVNGVGKTTSVGKLAGKLKDQGRKVILAAADTFRAAAGEQLTEWANRAGVEIIGGSEGADPASVVYDAVCAAKARKADVLLMDTAGRLHNKNNLMEELKKICLLYTSYTFMNGQRNDLQDAEEALKKIISELDEGMKRQFKEQFVPVSYTHLEVYKRQGI